MTAKRKSKPTPAVYLIHGWTTDASGWEAVVDRLKQVGISLTVLTVPGLTDPSPVNQPLTISDYEKWLSQQIPGGSRAIVIGHSNGGRIGLNFVSRWPKTTKIKRLILINSAGIRPRRWRRGRNRALAGLAAIGRPLGRLKFLRRLTYKILRVHDYEQASTIMKKTLTNLLASDAQIKWDRIEVPTCLIWGESDDITPLWQGRRLASNLKQCGDIKIIKAAGHNPHRSHPDELVRILVDEIDPPKELQKQ